MIRALSGLCSEYSRVVYEDIQAAEVANRRIDHVAHRLWIRDVWREPRLPQAEPWALWQFDARARVEGVGTFVDLNVFQGDRASLARF